MLSKVIIIIIICGLKPKLCINISRTALQYHMSESCMTGAREDVEC